MGTSYDSYMLAVDELDAMRDGFTEWSCFGNWAEEPDKNGEEYAGFRFPDGLRIWVTQSKEFPHKWTLAFAIEPGRSFEEKDWPNVKTRIVRLLSA